MANKKELDNFSKSFYEAEKKSNAASKSAASSATDDFSRDYYAAGGYSPAATGNRIGGKKYFTGDAAQAIRGFSDYVAMRKYETYSDPVQYQQMYDRRKNRISEIEEQQKNVSPFLSHVAKYGLFTPTQDDIAKNPNSAAAQYYKLEQERKYLLSGIKEMDAYAAYRDQQIELENLRKHDVAAGRKEVEDLDKRIAELSAQIVPVDENIAMYSDNWEQLENNRVILEELDSLKKQRSQKNAYNNKAEVEQRESKLANAATGSDDFGQMITPQVNDNVFSNLPGKTENDLTYRYINGDDKTKDAIMNATMGGSMPAWGIRANGVGLSVYDRMNENEISIYNYYYAKEGKEKANEWLDTIRDDLNARTASDIVNGMEGFQKYLFGVQAGLNQWTSGLKALGNKEGKYVAPSVTQYASSMIRDSLLDDDGTGNIKTVGYDAITSVSNMMPSILIGKFLGGAVGALAGKGAAALGASSQAATNIATAAAGLPSKIAFGTSIYGNSYQEMINLGYDKTQAQTYASLTAGSEVFLENAIGGISALGGKVSNRVIQNAIKGIDNAFARTAIDIGGNMFSEGLEETLQDVLDPLFKKISTGEDMEAIDWEQAVYSGLLGAITAGLMESPGKVGEQLNIRNQGRKILNSDVSIDRLKELGSTLSADSVAYQLAGKVNENTGAYTIGRLFNALDAEISQQNHADIVDALVSNGMSEKIAGRLADRFAAVVAGDSFTQEDARIMDANPALAQVVQDVLINQNSTVNQRVNGYREILREMAKKKSSQQNTVTDAETAKASEETANIPPDKVSKFVEQDGKVSVKMESGETVAVNDVNYATSDDALLYQTAAKIAPNAKIANEIVEAAKNYRGNLNQEMYVNTIKYANQMGKEGIPLKLFLQSSASNGLGYSDVYAAYRAGYSMQAEKNRSADSISLSGRRSQAGNGKVELNEGITNKSLSKKDKAAVSAAKVLSKATGLDFLFVRSETNENGERVFRNLQWDGNVFNGAYFANGSQIVIDLNAGSNGQGLAIYAMSHEVTHFIKDWNARGFQRLQNFLFQYYGKNGVDVDAEILNKMDEIRDSYPKADETELREIAVEEFVADSMQKMLSDTNAMEMISQLRLTDRTLAEKIRDHIRDVAKRIRAAYKGLDPEGREAELMKQMVDQMDELSRMWAEGVAGAAENMQKAKEASDAAENSTAEDGSVKQQGRRVGTDRMRWVVENDILDKREQATFWKAIADQRKLGYNKNKTFDGDLIIDVGSKLVITDGNFNNPSISTVIEFNETYEDTLAYFKGCIYETAKRFPSGYRETIGIIEEIYGSGYVTERNAGDYRSYGWEDGRGKGTDRRRYSQRTKSSLEFQDAAKSNGMNVEQDVDAVVISDKEGNPVGMLQADGSTRFSMSTYRKVGKQTFHDYLAQQVRKGDLTQTDMNEMIRTLDAIYDICKQYEGDENYTSFTNWSQAEVVTDVDGNPLMSVIKENGEYVMNLDFSLVCKKRRTLDRVLNELVKSGIFNNNTGIRLDKDGIVSANQIIRSHGFEVACALCFVDAKRFRQANVAKEFKGLYNMGVKTLVRNGSDMDIGQFNYAGDRNISRVDGISTTPKDDYATWLKNHDASVLDWREIHKWYKSGSKDTKYYIAEQLIQNPNMRQFVNEGDFMSSAGFEAVKKNNPDLLTLYNKKKGSAGPKAAFGDVQYLNDVAKKKWSPEKAFAVGGVRVQSFSDYIPRMIFDYVQMMADLAGGNLPAHSYTKEELYVKTFGLTGMKINMSLVPEIVEGGIAPGLDANGNYTWSRESFDYDEAVKIQNTPGYSANCGTIAIGISDAQIRKMMEDPSIRMIIPYHKSGINPTVAHLLGIDIFKDYTKVQNTMWGSYDTSHKNGKKVSKTEIKEALETHPELDFTGYLNAHIDDGVTPRQAAEAYVRACEELGFRPKFDAFAYQQIDGKRVVDENGNRVVNENYYKLLTDFCVYDMDGNYAPQKAVAMNFPTAETGVDGEGIADLVKRGLDEDQALENRRDAATDQMVSEVAEAIKKKNLDNRDWQAEDKAAHDKQAEIKKQWNKNPTPDHDIRFQQRVKNDSELSKLDRKIAIENARYEQELKDYQKNLQTNAKREARYAAEIGDMNAKHGKQIDDLNSKHGKQIDTLNAKHDAQIQRIEERHQKEIDKLKQSKQQRVDDLRKQYQGIIARNTKYQKEQFDQQRKRAMDRRERTVVRNSIKNILSDLDRRMNHPKEGKYIPANMRRSVAEVLASIDRSSGRKGAAADRLATLSAQYAELAKDTNGGNYAFDGTVAEALQRVASMGVPLRDMDLDQLKMVRNALKMMNHVIKESVYMHGMKLNGIDPDVSAFDFSKKMMQETRSIDKQMTGVINKFMLTQSRPELAFRLFGAYSKNSYWEACYNALNDAQRKSMDIQMNLGKLFNEIVTDKQAATLFSTKKESLVDVGLQDANGNAVPITRGMMLSLYMHLMNEENARHVMQGGLTVPDMKAYYKGKTDEAYTSGHARVYGVAQGIAGLNEQLYQVNQQIREAEDAGVDTAELEAQKAKIQSDIEAAKASGDVYINTLIGNIREKMTAYDWNVIHATQELYRQTQPYLNAATRTMYGFDKATVENYFPIITDSSFLGTQFDSISANFNLENAGFMKERKRGSNPILLSDIIDTNQKQIKRTAQYAAMAPTLRDFNKVFGSVLPGFNDSVQNALNEKFGASGKMYIEHLMGDLNGGGMAYKDMTGLDVLLSKVRGNMAGATLSVNPRVALSQAASLPTAAAELGTSAVTKAMGKAFTKADLDNIAKYSPLLWYRMQGNSSVELGNMQKNVTTMGKIDKYTKWATGWISSVDAWTVGRLWFASEYWVQDNTDLKKGTEEYYQAVADKFNKTVERTQPNYSTMQRSDILRSKNEVIKMLTMFTTQRNQNFNILYDAALDFVYTKKQLANGTATKADMKNAAVKLASATTSQLTAAGVYVAIRIFADALLHNMKAYRDDDEEITWESVGKEALNQFLSTLAGTVMLGSDLYSAVYAAITKEKYWGMSLSGISTIGDAVDSLVTLLQSDKKTFAKNLKSTVLKVSTAMGLPANNVLKLVNGMRYHIEDIANGQFMSMEAGVERSNKQMGNIYYRAIMTGDTDKANAVYDRWMKDLQKDKTERDAKQTIDKIVWGLLYQNDSRILDAAVAKVTYNQADFKSIAYAIKGDGNFTQDQIVKAINNRATALTSIIKAIKKNDQDAMDKAKEDYGIQMFARAQAIANDVKVDLSDPDDPDALSMYDMKFFMNAVSEGDMKSASEMKDEIIRIKVVNGDTQEDAEKNFKTSVNSKTRDAFMNGEISRDRAIATLVKFKDMAEDEAESRLEKWTWEKENPDIGEVSETAIEHYNEWFSDGSVPKSEFVDVYKFYNATNGDKDANGKSIKNSKTKKVLAYINGLNLTAQQKTNMALSMGYSQSTVAKYKPW